MYDSHYHFLFSLGVFKEIKENVIPFLSNVFDQNIMSRWHGVFVGYLTAPFYFLFGDTQDAGVMISSTIFLTILVLSTFGIGKTIFDEKTGLFSAFILSMYPMIFNQLRIYMLDLPLTAMVTLSIFLLLKTENLSNKIYSLFFGISVGCGLLIKFNLLGFILGPFLLVLCRAFIGNQDYKKKERFYNLYMILGLIGIISFSFIRLKFWEVLSRFYECSWLNPRFSSALKSFFSFVSFHWLGAGFEYLSWFLNELMNNQLSLFFFVVFLISLLVIVREKIEGKNILYLWMVIPLILLSTIFHYPNINRYFTPILPGIAIISGAGIMRIRFSILRVTLIFLIIFFGCFQYFAISYNFNFLPTRIGLRLPEHIFGIRTNFFQELVLFHRDVNLHFRNRKDGFLFPSRIQWPVEEILGEVLKNVKSTYPQIDIFFLDNIPEVYEPLEYISFSKGYPIFLHLNSLSVEEIYKDSGPRLHLIDQADYIVIMDVFDESTLPQDESIKKITLTSRDYFLKKTINDCVLVKKFKLPDKNTLLLFKKKGEYIKLGNTLSNLYVRNGRWQWYYKGLPITRDGFGGSFVFKEKTYFTSQAQWDIEYINEHKIKLTGKWQDIPITQEWEFDILNDKELMVNIYIVASAESQIINMNFFLPIQHYYKEWQTPEKKGNFSSKNILQFMDIYLPESINYLILNSNRKTKFPTITFYPFQHDFNILPFMRYKKDIRLVSFMVRQNQSNIIALSLGRYNCLSLKISLS